MTTKLVVTSVAGLVVLVSMVTGRDAVSASGPATRSVAPSEWRAHVAKELDSVKAASSIEQTDKTRALLSELVEASKKLEDSGRRAEAYHMLLAGQYIELAVRGSRQAEWGASVVAPRVQQLQTTLLYHDGSGLLQVLASTDIVKIEKESLLNMLEQAVRQEASWGLFPSEAQRLPKDAEEKVQALEAKVKTLMDKALKAKADERGALMYDVLDIFHDISQIYSKAGEPAKAYRALWTGYQLETKEGLSGESGRLTYEIDEFRGRLTRHGDELLQILHDKDVDLECKMEIMTELRTATSEGDFVSATMPANSPK